MVKWYRIVLVLLLVLMGGSPNLYAQASQPRGKAAKAPFNPSNPAEPDNGYVEQIVYYKVVISAKPTSAAYVSSGGEYTSGTSKYISTSSKTSKYKFSHWTLNGEYYSSSTWFYYSVGTIDADFVAHYTFAPSSPVEPDPMPEIKVSPLYLVTNIEGACQFNQPSGNEHEEDSWIDLKAYVAAGYEFLGWYSGATLISKNTNINYQMPSETVTLTAKVSKKVFNPTSPSEPDGSQENVQTTPVGDVNKDGVVNVFDVVAVVNYCLGISSGDALLYDFNGDGVVNVFDITKVINISME